MELIAYASISPWSEGEHWSTLANFIGDCYESVNYLMKDILEVQNVIKEHSVYQYIGIVCQQVYKGC